MPDNDTPYLYHEWIGRKFDTSVDDAEADCCLIRLLLKSAVDEDKLTPDWARDLMTQAIEQVQERQEADEA